MLISHLLYRISLTSGVVLLLSASQVHAQYKLETCEDLKITEKQYGASVVETATCVNPTKTFSPKGTLRNVNIVYSFPPVPTGAGVTFMVTKDDANGEYVQNIDYSVSPNHTTAYARLTINAAGKYFVRLVNYYNKAQVWATADFTVGADTVGPRAALGQPGQLVVVQLLEQEQLPEGVGAEPPGHWRSSPRRTVVGAPAGLTGPPGSGGRAGWPWRPRRRPRRPA